MKIANTNTIGAKGRGVLPEVLAYKNTVESDGGVIGDINTFNDNIQWDKNNELYSNLMFYNSVYGGFKKDASDYVNKIYDIKENDGVQNTGTNQPLLAAKGYDFDAVNDYYELEQLLTGGSDPFSISFWLMIDDITRTGDVIGRFDTGKHWRFSQAEDKVEFRVRTSGDSNSTIYGNISTGMYHVVGVYTGSDQKLYINKTLTSEASPGELLVESGPFYINTFNGNIGFLGMTINEIKIYNTALTNTQIESLYNLQKQYML
jgi:hypothetical protein